MTACHENCLGMNKTTRLILHQYHSITVNLETLFRNSIYFSPFCTVKVQVWSQGQTVRSTPRSPSNTQVQFDLDIQPTLFHGQKRRQIYTTYVNAEKRVFKFTRPVLDWYSKKKIMNGICLFTNKLRFVHAKYHLEVLSSLLLAYLSFL